MNSEVTFNPGPSYLTPDTLRAIQEIANSGFLSKSHRSQQFSDVSKQAIEGMHRQLGIPDDFRIYYQFSATAAMDTLLRNVVRKKSFHFVHGAFSKLFYKTALEIGLNSSAYEPLWDHSIDWAHVPIERDVELIAITHNETSTGLMWPHDELRAIRSAYPSTLIAIDATSTFGSVRMNWEDADIWFGSVQKCLGLPSGLGYLIVNPRAFDIGKGARGLSSWQSFLYLEEKMKVYQTPETPNMLNIALLARKMAHWDLDEIAKERDIKAKLLYDAPLEWTPYIKAPAWRSSTVPCFAVNHPLEWKKKALKANMILGDGYSPLFDSTVRVANFPAISIAHIETLIDVLK